MKPRKDLEMMTLWAVKPFRAAQDKAHLCPQAGVASP